MFNRKFSIGIWENSYSYKKISIGHVQRGPMGMPIFIPTYNHYNSTSTKGSFVLIAFAYFLLDTWSVPSYQTGKRGPVSCTLPFGIRNTVVVIEVVGHIWTPVILPRHCHDSNIVLPDPSIAHIIGDDPRTCTHDRPALGRPGLTSRSHQGGSGSAGALGGQSPSMMGQGSARFRSRLQIVDVWWEFNSFEQKCLAHQWFIIELVFFKRSHICDFFLHHSNNVLLSSTLSPPFY